MGDTTWRVAVTGASGSLGRKVIDRLRAEDRVERIVALDRVPLPVSDPKLERVVADVRDPRVSSHLQGCNALMHLAFIVERGSRDDAETHAVNVGGTQNVCEAAAACGVTQIVYASSIASYGFHADQDGVLLTEEAPIRGNDHFYYARHKAEVEHWLDGFEARHPALRVARMRPTIFLSEDSPTRPIGALRGPFHVYPGGSEPLVQITWEPDVAAGFVLALLRGAHGAFNLATEEPLSVRAMGEAMGKWCVPIPPALSLAVHRLAWRLGLAQVDPVWQEVGGGVSLLASAEKARRELGWTPRLRTTAEVVCHLAGRPAPRALPA